MSTSAETVRRLQFEVAGSRNVLLRLSLVPLYLLVLMALPAQAETRDDVMSSAYRCNVVSDDRRWLDCMYGAAQPMRAEIGLSPATKAQIQLALSPPPAGGPRDPKHNEALSVAAQCSSLSDDRQWLDCYYGALNPVRAQLGLAAVGYARSVPRNPEAAKPLRLLAPSNTGNFFSRLLGSRTPRVISRMSNYSFDGSGFFSVALANGQVWRQGQGDTTQAHWKKPAGFYTVIITDGAFGSFNLEVKGEPRLFKVEQQK